MSVASSPDSETLEEAHAASNRALTLVVPVYNEVQRFPEVAEALGAFVAGLAPGSELIVVDDGSTDETAALVEATFGDNERVVVMRRAHEGKGAAVRAGLSAARAPFAAFCDIDLSTPLSDLTKLVDEAVRTRGLVIASRAVDGSVLERRQHPLRESLGRAYNHALRATIVRGVHDTQCGAKAAPTGLWRQVLMCSREKGFAWDAEVVAIAQRLGLLVHEVPVHWSNDRRTRVRIVRDGIGLAVAIPRIARNVRRIGT